MKLKKGDHVRVIAGKDVGKEGDITRVYPETDRVIVDGVNIAKRHTRAQGQTMQGGIIDKDMPIDVSAAVIVMAFDEQGQAATQSEKVRICRKCGKDL